MAALTRVFQKQFGESAPSTEVGEFGSLANGAATTTKDPATIQALSRFLDGWYGAILGVANPTIEDMNGLFYLLFYQLRYIFERGVPEWNSLTTYYSGCYVSGGTAGGVYMSLADTNLNHALTDGTWWRRTDGGVLVTAINPATQSPYTMTNGDRGATFDVTTANGAMTFNLPTATVNFVFTVKDVSGRALDFPISIAGGTVEGVTATFSCKAAYGVWTFYCDGTNWWLG